MTSRRVSVGFSRVVCVRRLPDSRVILDPAALWGRYSFRHSAAERLALPSQSGCVLQVVSLISELSQCGDTSHTESRRSRVGAGKVRARPVLTLRLMKPFRCLCRARTGCTRRNCSENRPCTFAVAGKSVFMRVSVEQGGKEEEVSALELFPSCTRPAVVLWMLFR